MSLLIESNQEAARDETFTQASVAGELNVELEKQQGVADYLTEHLPKTEHRIELPQDQRCKVAVVIPAYAEGNGILRPLASLAMQDGIRPEEFETIVVVNRSSELPPQTAAESEADYKRKQELFEQAGHDNEQSIALISALQIGIIPEGLDEAQQAACLKIINSGMRVHMVDKSSKEAAFAPGEANVGSARDRGAAEAIERFFARRVDGIIAQSDADVAFDRRYLATLLQTFEQNPSVVGISGKADFEKLPEVEAVFPEIANTAAEAYLAAWNRLLLSEFGMKADEAEAKANDDVYFFGACMSSRVYGLALAGGVPRIAGGEDTALGAALRNYGDIVRQPEAIVHPLARFSARTEVGAGHGQRLLAAAESYANGGLRVSDPDSIAVYVDIRRTLADHLGEKSDDMPMLESQGLPLLDAKDMALLRAVAAKASNIDEVLGDSSIKDLRDVIQSRLDKMYPSTPIAEATHQIAELVTGDDVQKRQDYEAQVERLLTVEVLELGRREQLVEQFYLAAQGKDLQDGHTAIEIISSLSPQLGLNAEQLQQITTDASLMTNLINVAQQEPDAAAALVAMRTKYPNELTAIKANDLLQATIRLAVLSSL